MDSATRSAQVGREPPRNSIRRRLRQSFSWLALALLVVFLLLTAQIHSALQEREISTWRAQATAMVQALGPALLFDDEQAAKEVLNSLRAAPELLGAVLLNSRGSELARIEGTRITLDELPQDSVPRFQGNRLLLREPLVFRGDPIGAVILLADLEGFYRFERGIFLVSAVVFLLALALAYLLAAYVNRLIYQPLARIAATADEIAGGGDYSQRVNVRRDDELETFARSFNAMLDVVQSRERELSRHRDRLEEMVAARTAELASARDAAEAANRAKSAFLANMSHELRTPLNVLLGHAQILNRDTALSADQQQSLATMLRSGEHLLTLINDVLDLAKIEAGRLELAPAPMQVEPFFRDLGELFGMRARQKGIGFRLIRNGRLPAAVEADGKRLRQIVMNLLGNAIKFTEQGEVRLEISAVFADPQGAEREGARVDLVITVADTGIGIPAERIGGLFRPFQQEGSREYKNQGTGLGLAISKSLTEQMGGVIGVESAAGSGSRFTVRLPLATPQREQIWDETSVPPPMVYGYRRLDGREEPLRLLVVDDLEDNRLILRSLLAPLGFEMELAESGEAGVARAAKLPPDLILMDLVMQGIDGLEATRRIHALPGLEQLPVVACSASNFDEDRRRTKEAGCVAHLGKPVRIEELVETLGQLLKVEWRRLGGELHQPPPARRTQPHALASEERERLLQLLGRGRILDMRTRVTALLEGDPEDHLLRDLADAARRLDMKGLKKLLGSE